MSGQHTSTSGTPRDRRPAPATTFPSTPSALSAQWWKACHPSLAKPPLTAGATVTNVHRHRSGMAGTVCPALLVPIYNSNTVADAEEVPEHRDREGGSGNGCLQRCRLGLCTKGQHGANHSSIHPILGTDALCGPMDEHGTRAPAHVKGHIPEDSRNKYGAALLRALGPKRSL
eukprot:CAMPEP_0180561150 /NCGR_PEP_ID=MMETSP1037_2-20121125/3222_1 /TAXON_ID=632150 /ORGANISM="Azadinium spinosum, Strain 3D9" /LENGTH=172 /DNA_ID=CAMNT_0022577761 /DNA_START=540 /DNA_END=1055 /DNA_ORIENTATION=-